MFAYISVDYSVCSVFVCFMALVNCLLNAFAICLCVVAVLLLKEIVFLFPSPCMVLHRPVCAYFVCDPIFCLGVLSICLFCVVV